MTCMVSPSFVRLPSAQHALLAFPLFSIHANQRKGQTMKPVVHKGQIVTWHDDRGFGFVRPETGGQEAFLHISALAPAQRRPQAGDTIHYQLVADKNGKMRATAASIEGLVAAKQSHPFALKLLFLSLLPLLGSLHFFLATRMPVPFLLYVVMSGVTYWMYRQDKTYARTGQQRVPEALLHFCELTGGWPGAYAAQQKIRHKSIKVSYQMTFWTIVIIHSAFWLVWIILAVWSAMPRR